MRLDVFEFVAAVITAACLTATNVMVKLNEPKIQIKAPITVTKIQRDTTIIDIRRMAKEIKSLEAD